MNVSENGLRKLLQDKRLVGADLRVFFGLVIFCDQSNQVLMTQAEIGQFIHIDKSQVSKSVFKLSDLGYLKLVKRIGHSKLLMLNPSVVYKGTEDNKDLIIKKYADLNLALAIVDTVAEILKPVFGQTQES